MLNFSTLMINLLFGNAPMLKGRIQQMGEAYFEPGLR